jgi:trigger factor
MEKEELMEALAADLLERRALDLILETATYEDYAWAADEEGGEVATVAEGAVPESENKPAPPAPEADKPADEKPAEGS